MFHRSVSFSRNKALLHTSQRRLWASSRKRKGDRLDAFNRRPHLLSVESDPNAAEEKVSGTITLPLERW